MFSLGIVFQGRLYMSLYVRLEFRSRVREFEFEQAQAEYSSRLDS